jgi:2,5-dioxopentanoate dehydrogenase
MSTEPVLVAGGWRHSVDAVAHAPLGDLAHGAAVAVATERSPAASFRAIDPRSGEAIGPAFPISGPADVEAAVSAACAVADVLADTPPERIAAFLDRYAVAIEASADALAAIAHQETGFAVSPRLREVELPRTCDQLRQAAAAARSSSWTQPVIDRGRGLRSCLAPLGKPVLVFGPNNFPFAFNAVAGSDFASAIAARSPVIAKAHPSHPRTSAALAGLAREALAEVGLPGAAVQLLFDLRHGLGVELCADRRLGAIAFTGSREGGLRLKAAADRAGIPFFAELSSLNPVVLLPGALAESAEALAAGFFDACTLGSGQFCTKPGLLVVVDDAAGQRFCDAVVERVERSTPLLLLSPQGRRGFERSLAELCDAGAQVLARGSAGELRGSACPPVLLGIDGDRFLAAASRLQAEAFGPAALLVRVRDVDAAIAVLSALDGNLAGAIFAASDGRDDADWRRVAAVLRRRVGRLVDGRWTTGVAVSPAMNHGGPFPSSTQPGHTAVGMPAAIRRFAALQCWDGVRDDRLPPELRDASPGRILRCIDGEPSRGDVERDEHAG